MDTDLDIRFAAFQWLAEQEKTNQGIFSGRELQMGFSYNGRRITLKGQTGIWFPQGFSIPISITTRRNGPYWDSIGNDGTLTYAYRGTDPNHRDNRGLREARRTRTPLIYFNEIHDHLYQCAWPLIIIQDDPHALCVRAVVEPAYRNLRPNQERDGLLFESPLDVRRYATVEMRQRLHQSAFRELVIHAYDGHCAICRLHHPELLDAAHIIADLEETGIPVVNNGLSLCKIHHAAYDQNIIGIDQDHHVHVREDILKEHDGPMLLHGLQELDGWRIVLPHRPLDRPDPDRLAERFRQFQSA